MKMQFQFHTSTVARGLLLTVAITLNASVASGDMVEFILTGAQGDGLLPGNIDPGTTSMGSGDIGPTGVIFDLNENTLFVDIGWGSENGFSDLSGEITLLHLHGPTPSLPPDNFGEVNTDILVNLGNSLNFDSSSSGGGLVDQFFLSNTQADYLLSGRTYINVHTEMYPTGEIRGYLLPTTPIPEPAMATMVLVFLACQPRRRA